VVGAVGLLLLLAGALAAHLRGAIGAASSRRRSSSPGSVLDYLSLILQLARV
jgi:hypothetical protein